MKHVAIVGASLAGLSAARALRAKGFDGRATVVGDEAKRPYARPPLSKEFLAGDITEADLALESDDEDLQAQLGSQLGAVVASAQAVHGTTMICGVEVAALTGTGRVTGVDLVDGSHLPADVVVVGIGGVPTIEWLHGSGLRLGK